MLEIKALTINIDGPAGKEECKQKILNWFHTKSEDLKKIDVVFVQEPKSFLRGGKVYKIFKSGDGLQDIDGLDLEEVKDSSNCERSLVINTSGKLRDVELLKTGRLREEGINISVPDRWCLAVAKIDGTNKKVLLGSYHGIYKRQTKAQRMTAAKRFAEILKQTAEKFGCQLILAGADTNAKVANLVQDEGDGDPLNPPVPSLPENSYYRFQVFDDVYFSYPRIAEKHHRCGKAYIDGFYHNSGLQLGDPETRPMVAYNVEEEVLPHHPILATFKVQDDPEE